MASVDSLTASFYDNEQYSDIIIKFGEHQVRAHKIILAQQSGYFAAAFLGLFQVASNPVIDLGDDDDPKLLNEVIMYLYRHGPIHDGVADLCLTLNQLIDIYLIADKYDIAELRYDAALAFSDIVDSCLNLFSRSKDGQFMKTFVDCIVKICGPSSLQFADPRLQNAIAVLCQKHYRLLLKDMTLVNKYREGELFDDKNAATFGLVLRRRLLESEDCIFEEVNDSSKACVDLRDLNTLKRTMNNFYDDTRLSDVTLTLGTGQKISAHKIVLAAHSSYLLKMLEDSPMITTIDLGNEHDSIATAAFIEEMYTCDNLSCIIPEPRRSISCLAEMYLLANRHERDDAAQEYRTRCEDVLMNEQYSDELLSQIAAICGPDAYRYTNTSLAEMAFQNILHRVHGMKRNGKLPETLANKLEDGSLLNTTFTRRFAREILASYLSPR